MIVATGSLTLSHPGVCFQGHWKGGKDPWPQEHGVVGSVNFKDGRSEGVRIETREVQSTAVSSVRDAL